MKRKANSPIDAHLGYWLRYVSNHISHAFGGKLADRGVTVAEWVVLRELYDGDATAPSALAVRLGMTRGAISKLADRLADKRLLARTADETDRRFQALALTPQGRKLVPELCALADRNDAEFFGHLTPAEQAMIETVMKDIVRRCGLRSVPIQ
ncbi:MAG TPA: MarR family transcriptional regulator [Rhizomicrobium sp.]|jgi:DNA-binding MarR family transcriptional regulator|nr:MarR family transcriptional regulator [Rhizomicrobium sp.]